MDAITRTDDPDVIEHRLLELAYTTDAPITAALLAYFTPCSIDAAQRVLDDLAARDRLRMEVDEHGAIHYILPDRRKLDPPPLVPAVARTEHIPLALRGGRNASPGLAAFLSLIIPGAGQLYVGNIGSAILWLLLVTAGYTLFLPGLFLHLFCIASAASSANRLNTTTARHRLHAAPM